MGKLKLRFIGVLVIILCLQAAFVEAARGGLGFDAVSLVGGGSVQDAVDISTEPQFKVHFTKNVASNAMWDNNSKCFSLISADNEDVPLNVTKFDDFDQRQNIFVQPAQPLKPGTVYTLKISREIRAKNGSKLGKEVIVTFKTGGAAPVQVVKPAAETGKEGTLKPGEEAPAQAVKPAAETGKEGTLKPEDEAPVQAVKPAAETGKEGTLKPEEEAPVQAVKPAAETGKEETLKPEKED